MERHYYYIKCYNQLHLAHAIRQRMNELGYITYPGMKNDLWFEKGKKEEIQQNKIPKIWNAKQQDGEDTVFATEWNLNNLFSTSEYKFKKPEVKVKLTRNYAAIIKEDHVAVGCKRIEFETVEEIYKAIQNIKKEQLYAQQSVQTNSEDQSE